MLFKITAANTGHSLSPSLSTLRTNELEQVLYTTKHGSTSQNKQVARLARITGKLHNQMVS